MIFNMLSAKEGRQRIETVTLPVPTTISSETALESVTIDVLNGTYTATAETAFTGQTKGYKNDIDIIEDSNNTKSLVLTKTDTVPVGAAKNILRSSTALYLDEDKATVWEANTGAECTITNARELYPYFTKTGSAITTYEMQATGFAVGNYLRPSSSFSTTNAMTVKTKIRQYTTASSARCIIGSANLYIGINSSNKFCLNVGASSTWAGEVAGTTDVLANTDYYLKCEKSGSVTTLSSSTDGSIWTVEASITSALRGSSTTYLGIDTGLAVPFTDGTIDLSKTEYSTSTGISWKPYRTTIGSYSFTAGHRYADENVGYCTVLSSSGTISDSWLKHPEDFTVSGTCQIQDFFNNNSVTVVAATHVATGFSAVKYLNSLDKLDLSQPFEFTYRIRTGSSVSYNQKAFSSAGFNIGVTSAGKLWIWLIDTTGALILDAEIGTAATTTTYDGKLTWDGTTYTHSLKSGGVYDPTNTVTSSNALKNGILRISTTDEYWRGAVYLDNVTLVSNGAVTWSPFKTVPARTGYLFLGKNNTGTSTNYTIKVITGIQNPTGTYIGSLCNPISLNKRLTLDDTLERIVGCEDIT